jgi:hypothetical protein
MELHLPNSNSTQHRHHHHQEPNMHFTKALIFAASMAGFVSAAATPDASIDEGMLNSCHSKITIQPSALD